MPQNGKGSASDTTGKHIWPYQPRGCSPHYYVLLPPLTLGQIVHGKTARLELIHNVETARLIVSHAECQQVRRDPEIIRCDFDRDLRQSLPTVDNLYALSALLDVRMDEILVAQSLN